MADIIIKILEAAESFDLLTLEELKTAMGIPPADTSQDALLTQLITRYSDTIATLCQRVFAKETVRETWRCSVSRRVFLSHWPAHEEDIQTVESPRGSILDPSAYEFEEGSGKLEIFGNYTDPVVVTYVGGYDLPDEAPPALKQACELLVREEQAYLARIAMSGIRSMAHKESRVQFYDPFSAQGGATKGGLGIAMSAQMSALLSCYTRYEV